MLETEENWTTYFPDNNDYWESSDYVFGIEKQALWNLNAMVLLDLALHESMRCIIAGLGLLHHV